MSTNHPVDIQYVEVDGGVHGFDIAEQWPPTAAFDASAAAFVQRQTA